jgi:hypothetical protein
MIRNNIQFFNAAEIQENGDGLTLYRFPKSVINALSVPEFDENGKFLQNHTKHSESAIVSIGIEIRFFSDANEISFELQSESAISLVVYSGDYQVGHYNVNPGRKEFNIKRNDALKGVKEINRFPNNMWRIVPISNTPVTIFRINDLKDILPFEYDEKPTMLVYGSSITQGSGAPCGLFPYVDVAGNVMGYQVKNKGIAGGCFCEKEVLEYLKKESFDIAYFELGTNIANRPINVIEERVGEFIDDFCKSFPDKKLFFTTPVRGLSDLSEFSLKYDKYFANARKIITKHAKKYSNTQLIDGHKLCGKDYYMSADLLHPSGFGHIMMGMYLAKKIKEHL